MPLHEAAVSSSATTTIRPGTGPTSFSSGNDCRRLFNPPGTTATLSGRPTVDTSSICCARARRVRECCNGGRRAGELWWPKKYREKAFLRYADYLQNDIAALLRKCKPGTEVEKKAAAELGITVEALRRRPATEAEKKTADMLGEPSVEALRKRLYRYRKRAGM